MSFRTRSTGIRRAIAVALLLTIVPTLALAQEPGESDGPDLSRWVRHSGAHRYAGYVTLGLATATAALGIFDAGVHPLLGYATAASATVSLSLGSIGFRDQFATYWPHSVLAGLATAGFITNVFLEGGSPAHIATGAASTASLLGAYVAILIITR